MRKWLPFVLIVPLITVCSGKGKRRPSDAQQKQIEQEHQKAMDQQKQLTSGEGNSMLRDEPQPSQNTQPQQKQAKPRLQHKPTKAITESQSNIKERQK
jgi:hypothetical protein